MSKARGTAASVRTRDTTLQTIINTVRPTTLQPPEKLSESAIRRLERTGESGQPPKKKK